MPSTLFYFMLPEDELSFLRDIEKHKFEVYPEASEPGYQPFLASATRAADFKDPAYYFGVPAAGEMVARVIKRGKDAGLYELDETRSPVFHYERSLFEDGELRSGRLWAELEVIQDPNRRDTKPDLMRAMFEDMRTFFKKRFRRSKPTGFFVGPHAARKAHEGLLLREAGRKGELVEAFK